MPSAACNGRPVLALLSCQMSCDRMTAALTNANAAIFYYLSCQMSCDRMTAALTNANAAIFYYRCFLHSFGFYGGDIARYP
jgi:hypothetical protein